MTAYAETGITTGKFVRRRRSDGYFWNTSGTPAFEVYNSAHIADYGIAGTETGATGVYTATDPASTTMGDFLFVKAAGASLAVGDLTTGQRWQDFIGFPETVSLAAGAITDSTFATTADPSTLPSRDDIVSGLQWLLAREGLARVDRSLAEVIVYRADDLTAWTINAYAVAGDVETLSPAVAGP